MKKLIAGNWKMNGTLAQAQALSRGIVAAVQDFPAIAESCDLALCVPHPHLSVVAAEISNAAGFSLGAQDCAVTKNGAHTGDVSAEMLADIGCRFVIVGHSERRTDHAELNMDISKKATLAIDCGLIPIICVGETEEQREQGGAREVVGRQLDESLPRVDAEIVVAYEPVWAIGTGKTASPEDVAEMHGFIRQRLRNLVPDPQVVRILYGGSMKPENAAELLRCPDVDGGLIGGASLEIKSFVAIAREGVATRD